MRLFPPGVLLSGLVSGTESHKERSGTALWISRLCSVNSVPLSGLWKRPTSRPPLEDLPWLSGFAAVFLESWAKIEALDIEQPRDVQDLFRHTADHSFLISWAVTPHCVTVHPGLAPVDGKQRFW